jgi:hypothetical protein
MCISNLKERACHQFHLEPVEFQTAVAVCLYPLTSPSNFDFSKIQPLAWVIPSKTASYMPNKYLKKTLRHTLATWVPLLNG